MGGGGSAVPYHIWSRLYEALDGAPVPAYRKLKTLVALLKFKSLVLTFILTEFFLFFITFNFNPNRTETFI